MRKCQSHSLCRELGETKNRSQRTGYSRCLFSTSLWLFLISAFSKRQICGTQEDGDCPSYPGSMLRGLHVSVSSQRVVSSEPRSHD